VQGRAIPQRKGRFHVVKIWQRQLGTLAGAEKRYA